MNVRAIASTYCPAYLRPAFTRIETSPLGLRLARGVFWSMAGAVISRGLMLVATVVVARLLGKTAYGELGMIQSTVGMFGTFAGFGLGLTATKHVAEFRQSDPARAGRIIALSSLVAIVTGGAMGLALAVLAPWLAEHTINAPHLTGVLRIGALILFLNAINGAQTGALSGFEAFRTVAYVNLLVGLLSFPVLICGAWLGGLTGAIWALVLNLGFNLLSNHLALRHTAERYGVPLSPADCTRELPVLWQFSLPAVLSGTLVGPVSWLCNAMLVNRPAGYSEMGIFAAALVFHQVIFSACQLLSSPLLALICSEDTANNRRLGAANILSSWALGLVFAIPLLCFPEVAEFLLGQQYREGNFRLTLTIVLFYNCILTYRTGLLRVLQSKGLLWWGLANNLLWAIVLVPTAYYAAEWGAVGLACSYAIAYSAVSVVFVPVYVKYGKVPPGLVVSRESALVWLVVLSLVIAVYCNAPLALRLIASPFVIVATAFAIQRTWVRCTA